ncbi:isoprenylcysteine carboxylmethyltransferase family protein [Brevundimonas nasdae]|uniref:Isoprenylcysteine carboxylmethyltransferase family protein n=1 Tax=Brevundimonas nasdae TaxID=172043 RepID=A0ACD4VPM4_9CAUL|nr:isoprenylcysteine carboxylmethyltransferase family protein [Brevundimonas nasdae]WOB79912.1 isoprenylcysteine carboxylmethyltransferase family protein [Brevundimonas nasdae]
MIPINYSEDGQADASQRVIADPPRPDGDARSTIDIQSVQRWRKAGILVGGALLVACAALVTSWPLLEHPVEHLGLIAITVCIIGRAWCSLYIGGRKKQEIVSAGPYSVSRNPLYVFSFIGAFGIGAQSGSLSVGLIFALACWLVFRIVVGREERYLSDAFGNDYQTYRKRTPRFLPKPSLWRDEAEVLIRPVFFVRTVRDGFVFLLALPLFEGLELLRRLGGFDAVVPLP